MLTRRQRQVLACAAEGLCEKETAVRLGVSPYTVKTTAGHARARSSAHAVALALRAGLID